MAPRKRPPPTGPCIRTAHDFLPRNPWITRNAGLACCRGWSLSGGARGNLHLERRTLTQGRLDPDAATVHLHDLLGDGESEAGAALGLGKGAVDLMELLEDARPLVLGNARPRIGHADVEVIVDHLGSHAHLARVREFDGVAYEIE